MSITVKYFGVIAEQTGTREEELSLDETGRTVDELKSYCLKKYNIEENGSLQLAVNQELKGKETLEDGDEVAFLPPYAGG